MHGCWCKLIPMGANQGGRLQGILYCVRTAPLIQFNNSFMKKRQECIPAAINDCGAITVRCVALCALKNHIVEGIPALPVKTAYRGFVVEPMYYLSFFAPPYNSLIEGNTAPTTAIPAMKIPDRANHVSTPIISAKHPAAIKPKGMASDIVLSERENTRPRYSGLTISWYMAVCTP